MPPPLIRPLRPLLGLGLAASRLPAYTCTPLLLRATNPNGTSPHTPLSPPRKRTFTTTPAPAAPQHHFDTLHFVERLKSHGFSEKQSAALLVILSDVIEESISNLSTHLTPRTLHSSTLHTQSVDFTRLRSELSSLHTSELSPLRTEQERLAAEISRLSARLREEVQRAQSSVKLDLSLEKGRIREESSVHELRVKETDTRIEKEVGELRGLLESVKFSTLQWLIGVCTGTAALLLGVWRLLM